MGPGDYTRGAGTMSGRASSQQGLESTCKDLVIDGITEGTRRDEVWRMSPYERRRKGNALPDGPRGRPERNDTPAGQRGSGHSAAPCLTTASRRRSGTPRIWRASGLGDGITPHDPGGCEPALKLGRVPEDPSPTNGVQSRGQNRTRETRPSGIAGGPEETWSMVELGTHPATERAGLVTLRLRTRAPQIYPDIRTHGLKGGIRNPGSQEHRAGPRPYQLLVRPLRGSSLTARSNASRKSGMIVRRSSAVRTRTTCETRPPLGPVLMK